MISRMWMLCAVGLAVLPVTGVRSADSVAESERKLQAMPPARKDELRSKQEFFAQLTPAERDRLRRLHEQLSSAGDGEQLTQLMLRYSEWLKSLSLELRAELADLPPDQRIPAIKKILEQQERQRFQDLVIKPLPKEDYDAILDWFNALLQRNTDSLLAKLEPEERTRLQQISDPRWRWLEAVRLQRPQSGGDNRKPGELVPLSADDIQQLSSRLSGETRKTLDEAPDEDAKRFTVWNWVHAATMSKMKPRISSDELQRFLAELDPKMRDYLENLPRDRMLEELRRMYFVSRFRGGGDRGRGSFRGWRPGESPPPGAFAPTANRRTGRNLGGPMNRRGDTKRNSRTSAAEAAATRSGSCPGKDPSRGNKVAESPTRAGRMPAATEPPARTPC